MPEILYRKWRPRSFSELAGQEHVATTLTNALASGRVAHAYLFAGPRGTGKTSAGRLLGKALNCKQRVAGEPCNECESCLSYLAGRAMDLVELDAASNRGIDEIRSLRDKVAFAPGAGDFKVYLIDEVHMLTEAAFNALLKTLEEPPPHVVFILATTETHKVPATIASRCQRFDFRRPPLASIIGNLERICEGEDFSCEPAALELIARSATGSHRDAVNLLDQLVTSYGGELTFEHVKTGLGLIGDERAGRLAKQALAADLAGGLETIGSVRDDGLDLRQFQRELVDELRNLLLVKSGVEPAEGVTAERKRELQTTVASVETPTLLRALRSFGEADLKPDPNSTLPLDIALAECVLADGGRTGPSTDSGQAIRASGQGQQIATAPRPESPEAPTPAARRETSQAPPRESPRPEPVGERLTNAEPQSPNATTTIVAKPANGAVVEPTLTAVREHLRSIYDAAKARSIPLGALIGACDIIEVNDSVVVLGFKFPEHAIKASTNQNMATLTEIVRGVLNRDVDLRCVHEANIRDWMQVERASRSPLVRAAQEMGARVIATEPEEQ